MHRKIQSALILAAGILATAVAHAHIEIASGPGFAATSQIVTFSVGHGCEGADTLRVRVEIPSEIAAVRVLPSNFGAATIELDEKTGLPVAVSWQKRVEDLLDTDINFYELPIRFRVPDAPFTSLVFPTHQECQTADGETREADWEPALSILPKRSAGWNKFSVPADIADLSTFFSDALIVWKGDAAYSSNPTTTELIAGTSGVSALTELRADDEIWVKY